MTQFRETVASSAPNPRTDILPTEEGTEATEAKCFAHYVAEEGLGWGWTQVPYPSRLRTPSPELPGKESPGSPTAARCGRTRHPL